MCRAAVIHNVEGIYEDCNGPGPFLLLHWGLARFVLPGRMRSLAPSARLGRAPCSMAAGWNLWDPYARPPNSQSKAYAGRG